MAHDKSMQETAMRISGPGVRGISYPAISLEEAVGRATQLWQHEHKNAAPIEAVATHWGYSPTSSGVRTAVAALLSFGIVADSGSGQERKIHLTPRGLDIVLDTPERAAALGEAVISPKIYAELLDLWGPKHLPSDQSLKVHLLRNKNFNPKAVDGFIKDFRASISFSGITKTGSLPTVQSDASEAVDVQGAVERGVTGTSSAYILSPQARGAAMTEREWFRGSPASDTHCRILVTGNIGPKEIGNLIKLLEAQKSILSSEGAPLDTQEAAART